MRKVLIIFLFMIINYSEMFAQIIPFTEEDKKQQIDFIKGDTLPVKVKLLSGRINTPYSEYNPILLPDSSFYFTSLRNESDEDFENLFQAYWSMRVYKSQLTAGGYSKPIPLSITINNRRYFTSNFTFNKQKNHIFFTRCQRVVDKELKCELWESTAKHGNWQTPTMLTRRINLPGCNTTQPFLVEYENHQVLYFVSDRPKGYGGMDIWYAVIKNGRIEDPVNLGSNINTPGNEITPFYDSETKTLYFSSNHHLGIGGYDIFHSKGSMSQWEPPVNMGVPINSEQHEYYFTVNGLDKGGYFSSNRVQPNAHPEDSCCYDIYSYQWLAAKETKPEVVSIDTVLPKENTLEKIEKLLPLTLYFHNDEPNPKSQDTVTRTSYQSLLADYLTQKELFKKEYAKGLQGEKRADAENSIELFFKDSVEKGFLHLELFASYLLEELQAGKNITIKINGYASALHKQEYNRRLSLRRIGSFVNYLREYQQGALSKYIDKKSSNTLTVQADPKGSAEAISKNVSDNIQDQRNSVYSISASLERRICVVEIVVE